MHRLGKEQDLQKKMNYLFKDILKQDPDKFELEPMYAAYLTIVDKLNNEDLPNPDPFIVITKRKFFFFKRNVKYYLCEDLLDMQLKFLIELTNLDLDLDTCNAFHQMAACMYREDWSKPYNKKEYIRRCEAFYYAEAYYSLQAYRVYSRLIVTLKETYPTLYEGDEGVTPDGRKMYDLLDSITKDDITKEELAGEQPIERAFRWMEDKKIEQINNRNKNK